MREVEWAFARGSPAAGCSGVKSGFAGGGDQPAASRAALYRATGRRRWIRRRSKPTYCKPGSAIWRSLARERGEVGLHKWVGPSGKSSRLTLMGGKASCPGHPTCTGPDQAGALNSCPGEAPPRRGSVQSLPHGGPPTPTPDPNLLGAAQRLCRESRVSVRPKNASRAQLRGAARLVRPRYS